LKALLQRTIWQRFPARWRQAALVRATTAVAPRPDPDAKARSPIIVVGALRSPTGLGQSARLCHDALKLSGHDVFGIDLSGQLMQPRDVAEFSFRDGRSVQGAGTVIAHVNAPFMGLAMLALGRSLIRQKRVVGYWHWELPMAPSSWSRGVPFVHEIWAPSRFTADALVPIAEGRPVRIIPHPVALAVERNVLPRPARTENRPFTVLTMFDMGSSFARKNPCFAIEAFRRAFGSDQSKMLIVKTVNAPVESTLRELAAAIGDAPNICIRSGYFTPAEMDDLYSEVDALVSLHRSEGFGLPPAEAMLRGIPVVATDWSGSADFLAAGRGIAIPYRLVPAVDPQRSYERPGMVWAEANIDAAAEALRRLSDNPAFAQEIGHAAREFALKTWSASAYSEAARAHLLL
jgi:glycosyltransferase involved in cell wall biosynthesis